ADVRYVRRGTARLRGARHEPRREHQRGRVDVQPRTIRRRAPSLHEPRPRSRPGLERGRARPWFRRERPGDNVLNVSNMSMAARTVNEMTRAMGLEPIASKKRAWRGRL